MISNQKIIELPKELTIFTVEEFWEILVESIQKNNLVDGNLLILDFEALEKIDGSGVQLLLSLGKTMLNEQFQVSYRNVSEPIEVVLNRVGLEDLLVMEGDKSE